MKKKVVLLVLSCAMAVTLCACKSEKINKVGEHTDSYESIDVASSEQEDKETTGTDGSGTYKTNKDGSVDTDMSFLGDDTENTESNEPGKTQFEINQEVNQNNTSSDSEDLDDKFGLKGQISFTSVINEITKIAERDNYSSVEVVENPELQDYSGDMIEYIVRFDTYDYYVIMYYINEGCVSYHDDTGDLASMYNDNTEEDTEWYDE